MGRIHYFGGPRNGDIVDEQVCPVERGTNIRLLGPQRDEAYEVAGDCAFYMGLISTFDRSHPLHPNHKED